METALWALWEAWLGNIGPIRRAKACQFKPPRRACLSTVAGVNKAWLLLWLWLTAPLGVGAAALDEGLAERVQALALQASAQAAPGLRVEVRVGALDARLRLAPCENVQPYLPAGTRLWGNARIGLRCADATVRWNV